MVGSAIAAEAAIRKFDTFLTYNTHKIKIKGCHSLKMDIVNSDEVSGILEATRPDITIHAAALTDADHCELNEDEAYEVNVLGTENVAKAAANTSSRLVHISTNFVFDGQKGFYSEEDEPRPINIYGRTKLMGEHKASQYCDNFCVVRITPFGWDVASKLNFVCWVLSRLEANRVVEAYDDIYNSPMLVNQCAAVLLDIALRSRDRLYHLAGVERLSRYEFAHHVASVFGYSANLVKQVTYGDRGSTRTAKLPKDTSLNIDRIVNEFRPRTLTAREGLEAMRKLKDGSYLESFSTF
jgi:dTDP-4-dehydrorhamnose reductase